MEEYKTIINEIILQLQFTVPLFCLQHLSDRYLETPEEPVSFTAFFNMHVAGPVHLTAYQNTSLTVATSHQNCVCSLISK